MRKPVISIIGPLGDFGGRELETGFIAKTLINDGYVVHILSTLSFTNRSQLFEFVDSKHVSKLNDLVIKNSLWLKFCAYLSFLKSNKSKPLSDYCSNALSRKTGYKTKALDMLKSSVDDADIVFLCSQISSAFTKEIIEYCNAINKTTVIRTSSMVLESDRVHKSWLEKVTHFIHHSESNALRLSFLEKHNYSIIDQCTFKEDEMLAMKPSDSFKSLLFIGRLSPEKGLMELVEQFVEHGEGLDLTILGDGSLVDELKSYCDRIPNINLKGFVSQSEIVDYIKVSDAIVISSIGESGPLVGLEAMASARLVISTKVGAMQDRLNGLGNQFWFSLEGADNLGKILDKIKGMASDQIKFIAIENRKRYRDHYTKNTIENLYKKVIFNLTKLDMDNSL